MNARAAESTTVPDRQGCRVLAILETGDFYPSGLIRGLIYREEFARYGYRVTFRSRFSPRLLWARARLVRWIGAKTGWTPRLLVFDGLRFLLAKLTEAFLVLESSRYDVIYTSKLLSFSLIRRLRGPIVYDFGDAMWLDPKFPWFNEMLARVDEVTTDNVFTAKHVRRFNPRCTVVPDVAQVEAFDAMRSAVAKQEDRVVLGWIGTPGSDLNLEVYREGLERIGARYRNVELRLLGVGPRFRPFQRIRFSILPVYDRRQTVEEVLRMHIGLFPLVDDEAAIMRGVTKAAIYMAGEAVVFASPVGENVSFIEDGVTGVLATGDWEEKLAGLIENPQLRRRIAETALAKVRRERTISRSFAILDEVLQRNRRDRNGRAGGVTR